MNLNLMESFLLGILEYLVSLSHADFPLFSLLYISKYVAQCSGFCLFLQSICLDLYCLIINKSHVML